MVFKMQSAQTDGSRTVFHSSLFNWIEESSKGRNILFVTLTTATSVCQPEFEETIRLWLRKLKSAYLGRSACHREIFFFVVFAKTYPEKLHAHTLIDGVSKLPSEKTFKCEEPFIKKAVDEWFSLDSAAVRSAQNICALFDLPATLGYLLRGVRSPVSLDCISFVLLSLPTKYINKTSHVPWTNNKAIHMRVYNIKTEAT